MIHRLHQILYFIINIGQLLLDLSLIIFQIPNLIQHDPTHAIQICNLVFNLPYLRGANIHAEAHHFQSAIEIVPILF